MKKSGGAIRPETVPEPGPGSGALVVRVFRDCEEISALTKDESHQTYLQLSAGRFLGSTTRLLVGDMRLHWSTISGHTLSRFCLHDEFILISLPVFADALTVNGQPFTCPTLVQRIGGEEHVRSARNYGFASTAVRARSFPFVTIQTRRTGTCGRVHASLEATGNL